MISFSDDDEEVLNDLNVVEIIGTDTIDRDGLPIVEVDIKWNGLSVGEGEISFDEIYKGHEEGGKIPQSLLFLSTAINTFLGDM